MSFLPTATTISHSSPLLSTTVFRQGAPKYAEFLTTEIMSLRFCPADDTEVDVADLEFGGRRTLLAKRCWGMVRWYKHNAWAQNPMNGKWYQCCDGKFKYSKKKISKRKCP
jgi:hypothetical protein